MWYWWVFRLWKFKCRKRLIDKLIDEYIETVEEEVEIVSESKNKCNSWNVYIVLLLIFFTISVSGIVTWYVYSQWLFKEVFTTCWL